MGLVRAVAAAAAALWLGGCSGAPPEEGPDFEVDNLTATAPKRSTEDTPPATDSEELEDSQEESGPQVGEPTNPTEPEKPVEEPPPKPKEDDKTATYKGTLGSSPGTNFASSNCRYTVTMRNIDVEVGTNKAGDVSGATVRNLMVETTPGCRTPLIPTHNQEYRFAYVDKTGNGWRVALTPAPQNQPKANVTLDLVTKPDGFDANLTWKRYDSPNGSLNYTVRAQLALRKQ